MKKTYKNVLKFLQDYFLIIAGTIVVAFSINLFLVPFKIAPGGVTGIATVVYYLSGKSMPVGLTMLIVNLPLFLLGARLIGRKFFFKTLFSTVALSVIIDFTEPFINSFVGEYLIKAENASSPDLLLYALIGGALMGAGLGIVFRSGATTGGTDLAARILKHYLPLSSMGQLLLLIDTLVVIFASIVFKSLLTGLYAAVTIFMTSKIIDTVLEGVSYAKAMFIISDKSEEIAEKILFSLERGVTALNGTGMFTRSEKQVLFCVVQRAQLTVLKKLVKDIDPTAFLILADAREVMGEGFNPNE